MSQNSVRKNYIEADVFSATPQKLQLLLVEAAIKNVLKTKKYWEEGNISDGFDTITRAQDIVAEILCSLDVEKSPDIAKKLASIYVFIFRRLTEAGMRQDQEKLNDAYRVLCSERETWRLVCEKFGSTKSEAVVSSVGQSAQMSASDAAKTAPGAAAWVSSAPTPGNSKSNSESSATFTPSAMFSGNPSVAPIAQAKSDENPVKKSQVYSRPTGTPKSVASSKPVQNPVPPQQRPTSLGSVSNFQPHIPAMPTLGPSLTAPTSTPIQKESTPSPSPSLDSLLTGTGTFTPQSPLGTASMGFTPPGSTPLELGTSTSQRIELVNPMGANGQLSTATPMSAPPQNANLTSEASNPIPPTTKPVPGTGNVKTGLSWNNG